MLFAICKCIVIFGLFIHCLDSPWNYKLHKAAFSVSSTVPALKTYCLVWRWTSKPETMIIKSPFHGNAVEPLSLYLRSCFPHGLKCLFPLCFVCSHPPHHSGTSLFLLSEVLPATHVGRALPSLLATFLLTLSTLPCNHRDWLSFSSRESKAPRGKYPNYIQLVSPSVQRIGHLLQLTYFLISRRQACDRLCVHLATRS